MAEPQVWKESLLFNFLCPLLFCHLCVSYEFNLFNSLNLSTIYFDDFLHGYLNNCEIYFVIVKYLGIHISNTTHLDKLVCHFCQNCVTAQENPWETDPFG